MSGHLLSHSNSFGSEMEKDAVGCRAFNRNYYCRRGFLLESVKILGISSSYRKGATEYCVKEALREAEKVSGVTTEFITLRGKNIQNCVHCNSCVKNKCRCVLKDDFNELFDKFLEADGYIIGTPVYSCSASSVLQAFLSRMRPSGVVAPGVFINKVGGAIATGGTRNGGQEMANMVIHNFYTCYEILVTGGPSGNYTGACVWSKDQREEGAKADEVGMKCVRGLGKRVAEAALILKNGKAYLASQGIQLSTENVLWGAKTEKFAIGEIT